MSTQDEVPVMISHELLLPCIIWRSKLGCWLPWGGCYSWLWGWVWRFPKVHQTSRTFQENAPFFWSSCVGSFHPKDAGLRTKSSCVWPEPHLIPRACSCLCRGVSFTVCIKPGSVRMLLVETTCKKHCHGLALWVPHGRKCVKCLWLQSTALAW